MNHEFILEMAGAGGSGPLAPGVKERRITDPKMVQKTTVEGMRTALRMTFDILSSFQEQMEKMWTISWNRAGRSKRKGRR